MQHDGTVQAPVEPPPRDGEPRTYEITWFDGRRQRLEATRVHMVQAAHGNVIAFYGPMTDRDGGVSFAGRRLLLAVMGANFGIVAVRDVDAAIQAVGRAQPRSRWRTLLGRLRRKPLMGEEATSE